MALRYITGRGCLPALVLVTPSPEYCPGDGALHVDMRRTDLCAVFSSLCIVADWSQQVDLVMYNSQLTRMGAAL